MNRSFRKYTAWKSHLDLSQTDPFSLSPGLWLTALPEQDILLQFAQYFLFSIHDLPPDQQVIKLTRYLHNKHNTKIVSKYLNVDNSPFFVNKML